MGPCKVGEQSLEITSKNCTNDFAVIDSTCLNVHHNRFLTIGFGKTHLV